MTPTTTVSDIAHDRLVSHAGTQALFRPNAPMNREADAEHAPLVPQGGTPRGNAELLSPEKVKAMRAANTESQLKSNFWFEISRIALWSTTGLIAMSLMTFTATTGVLASLHMAVPLLGVALAAGVLIKSSQYSKRVVTERWFDVQDFQMQRQAALIAKSVEGAVELGAEKPAKDSWAQRAQASLDQADTQQISR